MDLGSCIINITRRERYFVLRQPDMMRLGCWGVGGRLGVDCLQGYPFVFGLKLTARFFRPGSRGVIATPNLDDPQSASHGLHAMLCVGYSNADQCFIVRNSWGPNWGHGGYCYVPYEYMANCARPRLCVGPGNVLSVHKPTASIVIRAGTSEILIMNAFRTRPVL